jgi:hypothetical protein
MVTADNIRIGCRLDELAGIRAAFALRFSFTTLRQVKCHAR